MEEGSRREICYNYNLKNKIMKYIGMSVILLKMFRLIFFIFWLALLAHRLCHDPLRHRESHVLIDSLHADGKVVHPHPGYVAHLVHWELCVCVCVCV